MPERREEPSREPSTDDLQRTKLQLEIRDLRHWWFRPSALASASTILVAVIAFISAIYIGYFDKARLDFERSRLAASIEGMKAERSQIENRVSELQRREAELQGNVRDLKADKASLESEYQKTLSGAYASVRTLEQANAEWSKRAKTCDAELSAARQSAKDTNSARIRNEAEADALRKQLAMFPPLAREGILFISRQDQKMFGRVVGANLGTKPGAIEMRVVRARAGERKSPDIVVPPMALQGVTPEWSAGSVEFTLSVTERNRLVNAIKSRFGDVDKWEWEQLAISFRDIEFEVRVTTADQAHTEWVRLDRAQHIDMYTGPLEAHGTPRD